MRLGAALLREEPVAVAHYADRFESVRHRGLRQAFQALNPGLLVCHPDTFQILYANAAARTILEIDAEFPRRLPDALVMTRQEEYCEAEDRYVACYRTELDNTMHDVRAFPVYAQGSSNEVTSVLVVIRHYNDVSWSLFEMLDKLPIAVAAVTGESQDVRYINRRALTEIYGQKGHNRSRRGVPAAADKVIAESLVNFVRQAPEAGEGRSEVAVGRAKVDMNFSRLGSNDGSRLIYWDSRSAETPKLWH